MTISRIGIRLFLLLYINKVSPMFSVVHVEGLPVFVFLRLFSANFSCWQSATYEFF